MKKLICTCLTAVMFVFVAKAVNEWSLVNVTPAAYHYEQARISAEGWTLNVRYQDSATSTSISVGEFKSQWPAQNESNWHYSNNGDRDCRNNAVNAYTGSDGILDLTKPVRDGNGKIWNITGIGTGAFNNPSSSLQELILPETLTFLGNRAFSRSTALVKVTFKGDKPTHTTATVQNCLAQAFYNVNDLQVNIFIPQSLYKNPDSNWAKLQNDTNFIAIKNWTGTSFETKYPNYESQPFGLYKTDSDKYVWMHIFNDNEVAPGTVIVTSNLGDELGSPNPAYGSSPGNGEFTIGQYAEADGVLYEATGYSLAEYDVETGEWNDLSNAGGNTLSWAYNNQYADKPIRLIWNFVAKGYAIQLSEADAKLVTITVSPADNYQEFEGVRYYYPNTSITLTANSDSEIIGWAGDVDSSTKDCTFTLDDKPITLKALFPASWNLEIISQNANQSQYADLKISDDEWQLYARRKETDGSSFEFSVGEYRSQWDSSANDSWYYTDEANNAYITYTGTTGILDLSSPVMDSDGNTWTITGIGAGAFNSSSSPITEAILPQTLTFIGSHAFASGSALTKITFLGDKPSFHDYAFFEFPASRSKQISFYIPSSYYYDAESRWAQFINSEEVSTDVSSYTQDGEKPVGIWWTGGYNDDCGVWIFTFQDGEVEPGTVIVASNLETNPGSPNYEYGKHNDLQNVPFTIDQYAVVGTTLYEVTGYTVEEFDSDTETWTMTVSNGTGREYQYTRTDAETRLTWIFTPVGYPITVENSFANLAVTWKASAEPAWTDTATGIAYYAPDTTITLTVQPPAAEAGFNVIGWGGDVVSDNLSVNLTVGDKAISVSPLFNKWVFRADESDSTKGIISDGEWMLNVCVNGNDVTVGSLGTQYDNVSDSDYDYISNESSHLNDAVVAYYGSTGLLDLSKKVVNGKVITAINATAFKQNSKLTEVRLPVTLTKIRAASFLRCANLKCVVFNGDKPMFDRAFEEVPTKQVSFYIPRSIYENPQSDWAQLTQDSTVFTARTQDLLDEFNDKYPDVESKPIGLYLIDGIQVWMHVFHDKKGFLIIVR